MFHFVFFVGKIDFIIMTMINVNSEERSFLMTPQKDFVGHLEDFIEEFERLGRSVELKNFNTQWQINIQNLSAQVDEYLKNSFSTSLNEYRKIFSESTVEDFEIIVFTDLAASEISDQFRRFKEQIHKKLHALEELRSRSEFILIAPKSRPIDNTGEFSLQEVENIKAKIDHVLETLILGQEIIYGEIDELKSSLKYPKKTFNEILKGKLMSLALDKLVSYEYMKWLYNQISGDSLQNLINQ